MDKSSLYPLKFTPIIKQRVWGGSDFAEKWLLCGMDGDLSVVSNGFLEGNEIDEIIEIYPAEFTGTELFDKYNCLFPILFKILHIRDKLSVQVHPDDEHAMLMHNSYGKTECWYILQANPESKIYLGFNRDLTPQELYDRCQNNTIVECLNVIHPKKGDVIFIEPGTVHAAEGEMLVAEIQQTSDITYRLYDWGREHNPETARELHLDMAIDCIKYGKVENKTINTYQSDDLPDCNYFKIVYDKFCGAISQNNDDEKCMIIYIISGAVMISHKDDSYKISSGELTVIPATMESFTMVSLGTECEILKIFLK